MTTPAGAPTPDTPLQALSARVTARTLNLLLRNGFTTVEQVAAVPDVELLQIRRMGAPSIASVRDAIAALQAAEYPVGATLILAGEQVRDLVTLLTTLAVYADAGGRGNVACLARTFLDDTVAAGLRPADSTAADTTLMTRLRGPATRDLP